MDRPGSASTSSWVQRAAVARKVSQFFDTQNQLDASYFIQNPRHSSDIYRTISRDIAERDAEFRHALSDIIKQRRVLSTSNVSIQFTELILAPSQKMNVSSPILVVIDALNNCGNETSRRDILEMLASKSMGLPSNFHVLVTARPQDDIVLAFQDKEHILTRIIGGCMADSDPAVLE
ncbi:hypothetical protein BS17DRAFT_562001 [Gyrodon lividus]|nr:hypothetical protein BS17DRAFT_562001 [Gyrodon lividus]